MDYESIFKKATLVQFSAPVWQPSRAIEKVYLESPRSGAENSDWLRGRKNLINPDLLAPIRQVVSRSRAVLTDHGLPFPIKSISLIPLNSMATVDLQLRDFRELFREKVEDFRMVYETAREEARYHLRELFNEADYPVDIVARFGFEWRYLAIDVPDKTMLLSPEIYDRERRKFEDLMEETRETAMTALRVEFSKIVTHLKDRLAHDNGKPRQIRTDMFDRINEFLNGFSNRNIFEDDTLVELAARARSLIRGVAPEALKDNKGLAAEISMKMAQIQNTIDAAVEDMPRRKIRMETAVPEAAYA